MPRTYLFTKFEKEKHTLPTNKVERSFFFGGSTLGCSQSDIDPQEDLAKFGYKLKFMKVRKIYTFFYIVCLARHLSQV